MSVWWMEKSENPKQLGQFNGIKVFECDKVFVVLFLNLASSFGGFLKEIHHEYSELWRCFTIVECIEFRDGSCVILYILVFEVYTKHEVQHVLFFQTLFLFC